MLKQGLLFLTFGLYGMLYLATSKAPPCDENCKKINSLYQQLRQNRQYIVTVYGSSRWHNSDSICVLVKTNLGTDWNSFADTVCRMAGEKGLMQQKVFIIKDGPYPYDTLAIKQCN